MRRIAAALVAGVIAAVVLTLDGCGSAHSGHAASAPATPTAAVNVPVQLACSDLIGLRPLVRDMRQQARLWKRATSGPGHLSQAAEADLAAPAWTSPGVYSGAFGLFNEANAPYVPAARGRP